MAQTAIFPTIKELTEKKTPAAKVEYWKINGNAELEFYVSKKGVLQFYAKNESGAFERFYPPDVFYPGLYSLLLPNKNITQVEIRSGNTIIEALR